MLPPTPSKNKQPPPKKMKIKLAWKSHFMQSEYAITLILQNYILCQGIFLQKK